MSSHDTNPTAPLDLSKWRHVPNWLLMAAGVFAILGIIAVGVGGGSEWTKQLVLQFGFSWLLAFMFFLSIGLGGLFLVLVHHLFDASWSVPIRRVNEHLACLLPWMALFFIPIAVLAPKLYPWMVMAGRGETDHALHAKYPLFTPPMFYVIAALCFVVWWFLSTRLRKWSLEQDKVGGAEPTHRMRTLSAIGIFLFAVTLTLGAIMWMKALSHQWFSTMYGVYYFAGSVWVTLTTVYVIVYLLKRSGSLRDVVREKQFYFIGSLIFAFTVFYAYISFSQYFIIWNGNMPEETFWYALREKGTWWDIGLIIIFGHFFAPFLALLRIDVKLSRVMLLVAAWAWLMHFIDMSFNIMPTLHSEGFVLHWLDLACFALFAGLLAKIFISSFRAHPAFPQKDPRFAEGLDMYVPPQTIAPAAPSTGVAK